jgi:hypothetical protein
MSLGPTKRRMITGPYIAAPKPVEPAASVKPALTGDEGIRISWNARDQFLLTFLNDGRSLCYDDPQELINQLPVVSGPDTRIGLIDHDRVMEWRLSREVTVGTLFQICRRRRDTSRSVERPDRVTVRPMFASLVRPADNDGNALYGLPNGQMILINLGPDPADTEEPTGPARPNLDPPYHIANPEETRRRDIEWAVTRQQFAVLENETIGTDIDTLDDP